jgi:hypothetical protein
MLGPVVVWDDVRDQVTADAALARAPLAAEGGS